MPKRIDLTGHKYGRLTIVKRSQKTINYKAYWDCICDCGKECTIEGYKLSRGLTVSCGCRAKEARQEYYDKMASVNRVGESFGKLIITNDLGVIDRIGKNRNHMVIAKCECGIVKEYALQNILSGHTKSCGCLYNPGHTTHGLYYHSLYKVWWSMHIRCYNEKAKNYSRYGGNGVIMCDEWKNDFMPFYNWAIANGWREGLEVDKDIKGTGLLYSPEMCLIVTPKQNSRKRKSNTYYAYNGETKILIEWAEIFNISYKKLHSRVKILKWSIEKALTTP